MVSPVSARFGSWVRTVRRTVWGENQNETWVEEEAASAATLIERAW